MLRGLGQLPPDAEATRDLSQLPEDADATRALDSVSPGDLPTRALDAVRGNRAKTRPLAEATPPAPKTSPVYSGSDTIDIGDGWTTYYGHTMEDVKKVRDGKITIREAFEKSSNVGISKITNEAYKEDPAAYVNRLYAMGLNNRLGLEIPGESRPDC